MTLALVSQPGCSRVAVMVCGPGGPSVLPEARQADVLALSLVRVGHFTTSVAGVYIRSVQLLGSTIALRVAAQMRYRKIYSVLPYIKPGVDKLGFLSGNLPLRVE